MVAIVSGMAKSKSTNTVRIREDLIPVIRRLAAYFNGGKTPEYLAGLLEPILAEELERMRKHAIGEGDLPTPARKHKKS